MGEFGHIASIGGGFCVDYWGAGPFLIYVNGKTIRFEDSDRFGPFALKKDGNPSKWQPGERHPFWKAWKAWKEQGRRLTDDRVTCVFDPPPPTKADALPKGRSHENHC